MGLGQQNCVTFTGSGKTLVSVLLIKDKAGGLNEGGHKRVTVFLAPKVLLVQQVCVTAGLLRLICKKKGLCCQPSYGRACH